MSYNIDTWKTKELDNLRIPLSIVHSDHHLRISFLENDRVKIYGDAEVFELTGILDNDDIIIKGITLRGIGSGTSWDHFQDILTKSMGKLVATQIWEGGDTITRLIVENGKVREEDIEI
jgi:hypothetical protein